MNMHLFQVNNLNSLVLKDPDTGVELRLNVDNQWLSQVDVYDPRINRWDEPPLRIISSELDLKLYKEKILKINSREPILPKLQVIVNLLICAYLYHEPYDKALRDFFGMENE